jgi:hypothetical protein
LDDEKVSNGGALLTAADDQYTARMHQTTYRPKPEHDLESIARVAYLDSYAAEPALRLKALTANNPSESAAAVRTWWQAKEQNPLWVPVFAAARGREYDTLKALLKQLMPDVRARPPTPLLQPRTNLTYTFRSRFKSSEPHCAVLALITGTFVR